MGIAKPGTLPLNLVKLRYTTILLYCVILLVSKHMTDCQTLNQSKTLMSDMLAGYDKRHRPVLDQSQPVEITVSFDIVAIQDFDEVDEKFSVVGVLYMEWKDESLRWDPATYGGMWSQMFQLDDIWYPILILANPYNSVKDLGDDWMTIRLIFNGMAYFSPGAVFKSTCSVDVTYYPFDTQTCDLLFVPWGFNNDEMKLISARSDVLQTFYSENGEWVLESTSVVKATSSGFDTITFSFKIKRKPLFLVVNIILPIIFLAVINVLVFVLPVESGERVSYAITVLLSIAVFLTLVGDNMPKTSEPMSILGFFLMVVLIISTLMCVVAIFNLKIYHRKGKVPRWCLTATLVVMCQTNTCCKRRGKTEDLQTNKRDKSIVFSKEKETRSDRVIAFEEESNDNEETTWQDVSEAVDRIAIGFFALTLFVSVTTFLNILISNNQP